MNGRVYDYNVGRFLSVDPFVHDGSQGINPYSYIMNNPLSGTDPSGYKPKRSICDDGGEGCTVITDRKKIARFLNNLKDQDDNGKDSNSKDTTEEEEIVKIGTPSEYPPEFEPEPDIIKLQSTIEEGRIFDSRAEFETIEEAFFALYNESMQVYEDKEKIKVANQYTDMAVAGYITEIRRPGEDGEIVTTYSTIKADLADPYGFEPASKFGPFSGKKRQIWRSKQTGVVAKLIITSKSDKAIIHNKTNYDRRSFHRGRASIDQLQPIPIFIISNKGNGNLHRFYSGKENEVYEE